MAETETLQPLPSRRTTKTPQVRCSIRPRQQKRTLPHSTLPLPRASKSSATRCRRREMSLAAAADLHTPLDHASRNLRVLVRRCVVAVWRSDHVPEAYQDLIRRPAEVCRFIARELEEQQLPTAARDQLRKIGEASAHLQLTGSQVSRRDLGSDALHGGRPHAADRHGLLRGAGAPSRHGLS